MTKNGVAEVRPSDVGIHQILVSASPADAITNVALATQDTLRKVCPSEIYARHVAPALAHRVRPLSSYRSTHARSVFVFHASIGQPDVHAFLVGRPEPIVLVYHNVTPAHYFEPYDAVFAELLTLGRRELEVLRPRVAAAVADSEYNARELEALGYRNVRVAPPLPDLQRLVDLTPRESTMHHLSTFDGPILLCVAQLMPHKRPDFLIEAMHVADTYHGMRAFLLFVGANRLEPYARAIREQIRELNLVGVHLVGAVDDADLVAMFRSASAVVTASEHEGFCVPVLEAMAFERPIVARACAAVPETVGDAGLLVPEDEGPAFFAEAVTELLANDALQMELTTRGTRRLAEITERRADVTIVDALLEVV